MADDDDGPAVPTWARSRSSRPCKSLSFECVKKGVSLGRVTVEKCRWTIGRAEDKVDTVLEHPSISRIHAFLQESVEGKWYLVDWSSHGTRLNKVQCPRGKYVPIHDGDVVSFAASERLFVVEGGTQEPPPSMVRRPRAIEEEPPMMNWGQAVDAIEEEEEDEALPDYLARNEATAKDEIKSTLSTSERREKDKKILEKLEGKVKKANNLQREVARLSAISDSSDGQRKALERSQAKLLRLTDEIADIEEIVREKNAQRDGLRVGRKNLREEEDPFESDLRDLTENRAKLPRARTEEERIERRKRRFFVAPPLSKNTSSDGGGAKHPSTYEELSAEKASVEAELESAQRVAQALLHQKSQGGNDALDQFLKENDDKRRREAADAVARDISRLDERRRDLQTLIAIAKPAHLALITDTQPVEPSPPFSQEKEGRPAPTFEPPPPSQEKEGHPAPKFEASSSPPPPPLREKEAAPSPKLEVDSASQQKRPAFVGPLPNKAGLSETVRVLASSAKRDAEADLEDGHGEDDGDHERFERARQRYDDSSRKKETKKKRRKEEASSVLLEGGDRAWVPPAGQDGSGRTRLNDVLGY